MKEIIEIKYEDKLFPEKLRNIKKPPRKLYAIGNVDLLNKPSLAIVGTRNITEYGIQNCEHFTEKLVQKDIPIISGMAIGTDTVAHTTSLKYRRGDNCGFGKWISSYFSTRKSEFV